MNQKQDVFSRDEGGHNYKCLPARTLQRRGREGARHWLVAYRNVERQSYRREKDTYRKRANKETGVTLDGLLLLQIHYVDEPFQLCSVDISERNLNSVKPEDFKVFENVAYIDASINSLSLGSFSCFASLRKLSLALNGISNMTFDAASFPHLQVLDLSYNSLSAEVIVSLGRLPHLKALHLTGNRLRLLPDLCSPNHDQLPAEGTDKQFEALEVLMLDDNKLSSEVFHYLANLKRLKYLNLQGNHISEIPNVTNTSAEDDDHSEENLDMTEHLEVLKSFHMDNWEGYSTGSSLPLPRLQFLNLAENRIAKEEALIAAALFPKLREIDIHSNPLATNRRGDPPLLTYYLQERLGVKIKRKKTDGGVRLPLKLEDDVPKRPVLIGAVCPATTQVNKREEATRRTTEAQSKKSSFVLKNTEHCFITQAENEPEFEFDHPSEEKESAGKEQGSTNSHKQSTSYETMMDVKASPDALKHVGIQTAVRMLEHRLRSFNVYRESKPKLNSIQTLYRERMKKVLPPLRPTKQPAESTDELFRHLKKYNNKSS